MSRNLCRQTCYHCESEVRLDEAPRPITTRDCGERMFPNYEGMLVANATCPLCEAEYLAWIDGSATKRHVHSSGYVFDAYPKPRTDWDTGEPMAADLSYRSTFNDEPGESDMPKWKIEKVRTERLR